MSDRTAPPPRRGFEPTRWIVARFAARSWLVPTLLALPLAAVLVLAYVVPVAIMAGLGFFATDPTGKVLPVFTLGHFFKFFGDSWYFFVLVRSVRIALFVTVLTVVLGYVVAYFLAFRAGPRAGLWPRHSSCWTMGSTSTRTSTWSRSGRRRQDPRNSGCRESSRSPRRSISSNSTRRRRRAVFIS